MLEARDELMSIGVSRHDDLVDCMTYAENLIQPFYGNNIVDMAGNNVTMELATSGWGDYGYGNDRGSYESPVDIAIGG